MALMDEKVRDYLQFRGLNATLKVLDGELRQEKERGFRVIAEHLKVFHKLFEKLQHYHFPRLSNQNLTAALHT